MRPTLEIWRTGLHVSHAFSRSNNASATLDHQSHHLETCPQLLKGSRRGRVFWKQPVVHRRFEILACRAQIALTHRTHAASKNTNHGLVSHQGLAVPRICQMRPRSPLCRSRADQWRMPASPQFDKWEVQIFFFFPCGLSTVGAPGWSQAVVSQTPGPATVDFFVCPLRGIRR